MPVTIVRHAESCYNAATDEQKRAANLAGAIGALRDADLTSKGEQQATHLAQVIAGRASRAQLVITSPLRRALRTAISIAAVSGARLVVNPVLREIRRDVSDIGAPGAELDRQFPSLGLEALSDRWWLEECNCLETNECGWCIAGRVATILAMVRENDGAVIVSHSDILNAACGVDLGNGEHAEYDVRAARAVVAHSSAEKHAASTTK
jgi:broad specificity phosphatase PhoE